MSFEKVTSPGKVVVSAALNTGEAATEITAGASKAATLSRQQKVLAFIAYAPWRHHPNILETVLLHRVFEACRPIKGEAS
jgi:hypothetical protein